MNRIEYEEPESMLSIYAMEALVVVTLVAMVYAVVYWGAGL